MRSTSGDVFAYEPVLSLPPALLSEYLEQMSRGIHDAPDPLAEALSITTVHLAEDLDTDHDGGRNYTRTVSLLRKFDGRVALVVDKDCPTCRTAPPTRTWSGAPDGQPSAGITALPYASTVASRASCIA